jgi:RNase P protein component
MILSKKITRTGVLRNALKRQIRVAYAECFGNPRTHDQLLAKDVLVRLMKLDLAPTKKWESRFGLAVQAGLRKLK